MARKVTSKIEVMPSGHCCLLAVMMIPWGYQRALVRIAARSEKESALSNMSLQKYDVSSILVRCTIAMHIGLGVP